MLRGPDLSGPLWPREGGWTARKCLHGRLRGLYCASPFMGPSGSRDLHHTAQLGNHIQALLLAQVLGTHDRLLVQQIAGPGLLLEVTLDDVYGPVHVLAGDLAGLLVGDSHSHLSTHLLSVAETLQPSCRAVVLQRPHGARQVAVEDTLGPRVQFSTPRA